MNVIFLDIDGVLTNATRTKYQTIDPKCVVCLNELAAFIDAKIVISSSRRFDPKLFDWLENHGIPRRLLYGITPYGAYFDKESQLWHAKTRGEEIKAWLKDNPDVKNFIIIDDEDYDMGEMKPYLLKTNTEVGLTTEDLHRLIFRRNDEYR